MDTSNAGKIFRVMEKLRKLRFTSEPIGDMPQSEFMIMTLIKFNTEEAEGVKISTLGTQLLVSNPAVSQMINVIEGKGYVERITTKNDRRIVYVRLTENGRQCLEEARQSFFKVANEIFEKMGEDDTKTFLRLLDKLYLIADDYKKNNLL